MQGFIASIFEDFHPADFHKLIPKFVWSAIATTNYDLVLERAYDGVNDKLQNLVVFKKNSERVEEKLKTINSLLYLKLHGCITDITDDQIPLILTPDQYINHRKGRHFLFERLQSLAYNYPFLWVGYSLSDPDIRAMIFELDELVDTRPRSYFVTPNMTPAEKRFWENDKKIYCIEIPFDRFLYEINNKIESKFRALSNLANENDDPIMERFRITDKHTSQSLKTFLSRDTEYIHKGYKTAGIDVKAFYKGYFNDFTPIVHNLDVHRSLSDTILSEVFLATEEEKIDITEFYMLKGACGFR